MGIKVDVPIRPRRAKRSAIREVVSENAGIVVREAHASRDELSSLALCKRLRDAAVAAKEAAAANFAPQYVPLVSKGIWFTPAGDTNLEKGEPLFAYFEVYDPLLAQHRAPSVEVHLGILDASTGKVIGNFAPVNVAPYQRPGSSVLPIARKIPIGQLPKGAYRLEVQATDSARKHSLACGRLRGRIDYSNLITG